MSRIQDLSTNITHLPDAISLKEQVERIKEKVIQRGGLEHVSVEKQLEVLDQLTSFELGQFITLRGGLDGFWTHYIASYPYKGKVTGTNHENQPLNEFESYLLEKIPVAVAIQDRHAHFKEQIQKRIKEGIKMASLPSGIMADFFELDFSNVQNYQLYGYDIDPNTLKQAQAFAQKTGHTSRCHFIQQDAWQLDESEKFDLLNSNGLNFYENDREKVITLYRRFNKALKVGGVLVTSYVPYPPIVKEKCEWNLNEINPADALMQRIIFSDLLDSKWQCYTTREEALKELELAGFGNFEVCYDRFKNLPTVVAHKL